MVAAIFGWLVNFGWRRVPALALRFPAQKAGLVAACIAALLYALIAGFAVPAQRTLYMLLVAGLAMLSGRIIAPSRVLALALLVVLLIDPWAILAAGFWLSFGVSKGITIPLWNGYAFRSQWHRNALWPIGSETHHP